MVQNKVDDVLISNVLFLVQLQYSGSQKNKDHAIKCNKNENLKYCETSNPGTG